MLSRVGVIELEPGVARRLAARADAGGEMPDDLVRDEELRVFGPAVHALRRADLVLAERLAVCARGVLLVRRAEGDVRVDDDERRALRLVAERLETAREHVEIVRVADARDVPAVRGETSRDVRGEGGR